MVLLIGSYGDWQARAARDLEPRVGCVVLGRWPSGERAQDFLGWIVPLLEAADLVLFWIEGPGQEWGEFELGYVLGLCRSGARVPVAGVSESMLKTREVVQAAFEATGANVVMHKELSAAVSAVEAMARCTR
jgi:hypothetical protein